MIEKQPRERSLRASARSTHTHTHTFIQVVQARVCWLRFEREKASERDSETAVGVLAPVFVAEPTTSHSLQGPQHLSEALRCNTVEAALLLLPASRGA